MPNNFSNDSKVSRWLYKYPVHKKCLTYLSLPICLNKKTSGLMGDAAETIFHRSEKWKILIKISWDNLCNTGKIYISYLEELTQDSEMFVEGDVHPAINTSPIKLIMEGKLPPGQMCFVFDGGIWNLEKDNTFARGTKIHEALVLRIGGDLRPTKLINH